MTENDVYGAAADAHEEHIMVLDRVSHQFSYQQVIFDNDLIDVLFCVLPGDGGWRVNAIPLESGSIRHRAQLPAAWGGLEGAELVIASGVPDAVFVDKSLLIGGAKSKEGALKMAEIALSEFLSDKWKTQY